MVTFLFFASCILYFASLQVCMPANNRADYKSHNFESKLQPYNMFLCSFSKINYISDIWTCVYNMCVRHVCTTVLSTSRHVVGPITSISVLTSMEMCLGAEKVIWIVVNWAVKGSGVHCKYWDETERRFFRNRWWVFLLYGGTRGWTGACFEGHVFYCCCLAAPACRL